MPARRPPGHRPAAQRLPDEADRRRRHRRASPSRTTPPPSATTAVLHRRRGGRRAGGGRPAQPLRPHERGARADRDRPRQRPHPRQVHRRRPRVLRGPRLLRHPAAGAERGPLAAHQDRERPADHRPERHLHGLDGRPALHAPLERRPHRRGRGDPRRLGAHALLAAHVPLAARAHLHRAPGLVRALAHHRRTPRQGGPPLRPRRALPRPATATCARRCAASASASPGAAPCADFGAGGRRRARHLRHLRLHRPADHLRRHHPRRHGDVLPGVPDRGSAASRASCRAWPASTRTTSSSPTTTSSWSWSRGSSAPEEPAAGPAADARGHRLPRRQLRYPDTERTALAGHRPRDPPRRGHRARRAPTAPARPRWSSCSAASTTRPPAPSRSTAST